MSLRIYVPTAVGSLRQAEIITGFTQTRLDVGKLQENKVVVQPITHPFVVVLSQDCDLLQDFERRQAGKSEDLLSSVFLCPASDVTEFETASKKGRQEKKLIKQNQFPRFHYLRDLPAGDDSLKEGLPELVLDFKRVFRAPTDEVYYWLATSKRRCRLVAPYSDHLCNRYSAYIGRVGLPLDHDRELPTGEELLVLEAEAALSSSVDAAKLLAPAQAGRRLPRWLSRLFGR